jgi:hypothetical protein
MRRDAERSNDARSEERRTRFGSIEWIRALPGEMLEPHPLVRELRQTLEAKDAALADKEREITRLRVALAFGLKEIPLEPDRSDGTPAN